jgi:hypothetical protein
VNRNIFLFDAINSVATSSLLSGSRSSRRVACKPFFRAITYLTRRNIEYPGNNSLLKIDSFSQVSHIQTTS